MTLPDLLRQVAYLLRNNGEPSAEADFEQPVSRGYSQYICDMLQCYPVAEGQAAREYLKGLGMPTGFGAFGETGNGDFSLEQQRQRMTWLFFAADLAEELGEKWVQYVRSLVYEEQQ